MLLYTIGTDVACNKHRGVDRWCAVDQSAEAPINLLPQKTCTYVKLDFLSPLVCVISQKAMLLYIYLVAQKGVEHEANLHLENNCFVDSMNRTKSHKLPCAPMETFYLNGYRKVFTVRRTYLLVDKPCE